MCVRKKGRRRVGVTGGGGGWGWVGRAIAYMMNTVFHSGLLIWFNLFTEMLISPRVGMQLIISV